MDFGTCSSRFFCRGACRSKHVHTQDLVFARSSRSLSFFTFLCSGFKVRSFLLLVPKPLGSQEKDQPPLSLGLSAAEFNCFWQVLGTLDSPHHQSDGLGLNCSGAVAKVVKASGQCEPFSKRLCLPATVGRGSRVWRTAMYKQRVEWTERAMLALSWEFLLGQRGVVRHV